MDKGDHIFFAPAILGDTCELSPEESHHAVKVLRLTAGTKLQVVDGKGGWHAGQISEAHPKHCLVMFTESKQFPATSFRLQLAVAPTKSNDRFEYFLEKATEIGVNKISPLLCERSERKLIKDDRLQKVVVSAMKQSGRAWLPKLDSLAIFREFVSLPFSGQKFIAHCVEDQKLSLKECYIKGENAVILIGPEGDFSADEIELAIAQGFQPVTLGNYRLRTETAALAACHTINLLNE